MEKSGKYVPGTYRFISQYLPSYLLLDTVLCLWIIVNFSGFYANMGNYKGFGDSKFVPALPMDRLEILILASEAAANNPAIASLWNQVH